LSGTNLYELLLLTCSLLTYIATAWLLGWLGMKQKSFVFKCVMHMI